jgi:hypothetical protein
MEATAEAARRARDECLAVRCQLGEPQAFAQLVHEMERPLLYNAAEHSQSSQL